MFSVLEYKLYADKHLSLSLSFSLSVAAAAAEPEKMENKKS
jgi:hypothetical protein